MLDLWDEPCLGNILTFLPHWHLKDTCHCTWHSSTHLRGWHIFEWITFNFEMLNHVPINVFSIKVSCIHPPIGNVIPVKTALVEEDCVKVFVFLQVAICRGKASRLRTASRVERFSAQAPTPHSAQVVLLASVGLVPKENVPGEYTRNEISSWWFV